MGFNTTYATCFFRSESDAQKALDAFEHLYTAKEESFIQSLKNKNDESIEIIRKFDSYCLEKIERDESNLFVEIDFNKVEEMSYVVEYLRAVSTSFPFTHIFSITFNDNVTWSSNFVHPVKPLSSFH